MNERTKELAKKADAYAHSRMAEIGGSYLEYYNEKFVELIVKECAVVLDDSDSWWYHGEKLNEHFGVEE